MAGRPKSDRIHRPHHVRLRLPLLLVVTVFLGLAGIVTWSAFAEIDRVVRAGGRVVPSEMPQFVQHLEGGVVSKVFVLEGDRVAKGAAIANISDVQAEAVVNERRFRVAALKAEAHRLEAETRSETPDWTAFLGEAAQSATEQSAPEQSGFAQREQELFEARTSTLDLSLASIEAQLSQRLAQLNEVSERIVALEGELVIAEQQMAVVQEMVDKEAGSRLELLEAMGRVAQFKSQLSDLKASQPRVGYEIEELRNRKAQLRAEFREGALLRLAEVRLEIDKLSEEISAAADRLQRTVVVSPSDGVVNRVFTRTVGGVVRPGEPIAEITPDSSNLVVEGWIDPTERASVLPGLRAIVRITAYDFAVYGSLTGKVQEVSADTVESEGGQRQYRVRVLIDPASYERFGQPVTAGMVATADVVIGRRTVLQYLTSPLTRGLETALRDRK
ncbi:MAG: HlyD family type I secretion periplasmic adaptor subunit [Rhodobacteraceae bacterium]|nr:HlyD family type I secretion periplasmic adaptor subunit [Paracoccaceae bacterium]MCZ8085632.1 HlyD family type I secretion periplasmic adaptor subunit [Paracoccaceae bacterium]